MKHRRGLLIETMLPVDPDLITDEVIERSSKAPRQRGEQRRLLLLIGGAGAVGSLARYAIGRLLPSLPGHFPWGTFSINLSGSLAIGFVLVFFPARFPSARLVRPVLATGFLGGYTTFSTYIVESDLLFRAHDVAMGVVYALSSLTGGLVAVFAGLICGRIFVRLTAVATNG